MMFGYSDHWVLWEAVLSWTAILAFCAILAWVVLHVLAADRWHPIFGRGPSDAKRILDTRLARGEIDSSEYRRLRDLITDGHHDGKTVRHR